MPIANSKGNRDHPCLLVYGQEHLLLLRLLRLLQPFFFLLAGHHVVELGVADWKYSRVFRVITLDHGHMTFADMRFLRDLGGCEAAHMARTYMGTRTTVCRVPHVRHGTLLTDLCDS